MHTDLSPRPDDTRRIAQRLRELPRESTPPFEWQEFRRRARLQRRAPSPLSSGSRALTRHAVAVAAALVLIVTASALWLCRATVGNEGEFVGPEELVSQSDPTQPRARRVGAARLPGDAHAQLRILGPTVGSEPVPSASSADEATERWLASLPRDPAIVHVSTRLAVTDLEDRIASVDDLLNAARVEHRRDAPLQTWQRERARLVDSLAQVRYAESLAAQLP